MAGSSCTKTVGLLFFLAFQLLTISEIYTGLSYAKDCEEGMTYERHHGVTLESCHIPEKVRDVYKYCRKLNKDFTVAFVDGVKLCYNPGSIRPRRNGMNYGSPPPPGRR